MPEYNESVRLLDRKDLFHIARRVAQNDGEQPRFFSFDEREVYDLDVVAKDHLDTELSLRKVDEALKAEFHRRDRFWMALYPRYELFKTQYDACLNRILRVPTVIQPSPPASPSPDDDREPSEELKAQVKSRDRY